MEHIYKFQKSSHFLNLKFKSFYLVLLIDEFKLKLIELIEEKASQNEEMHLSFYS